jgi:hypothetical protein
MRRTEKFDCLHKSQAPGWYSAWVPFARPKDHQADPFLLMASDTAIVTTRKTRLEAFVLTSPFAPFVLRFWNFSLTLATLIVAILIRDQERSNDVEGIAGNSTIFAIILAPFALLHILINVVSSPLYPSLNDM